MRDKTRDRLDRADANEHNSIKRALEDSERRYRALFDDSPSPIFVFDVETHEVLAANQMALQYYGYTLEEFLRLKITDIHPADEGPRLLEALSAEAYDLGRSGIWRHMCKDGTIFEADILSHCVTFDGRKARISIVNDVTESRQVESRLRESEERFRSTFEQAAVGMAHVSPEGRWLRVNRKLCDILGYSPERLLQLGLQDITPPEDLPANRQMMERLLTGARETGIVERRCIRADGSLIWAKITIAPFRTPDGVPSHFITVIEDISQEKEMEAQFLRAQRLESVGTLAGGVAHDLNNILAPIIMSVPMLRQDLDEEMRETLVSTIEASAQRGADIVRQILTFTRGIQGDRILLQPLHLLKEVELIARETFPKNIVIRAKYREDVWPVYGDPTQLRQALLNLALNARDATPSGGTVTLGAENIEVDEQYAATHGTGIQPGSYLVWSVSDTGAGIPPEIKDRIFDPFFTTKELGKGTGLGLSTVIGIVRGHGGALWVESGVGEGTTFTIYLPAAPGQVPAAREADGPEILQGNGEMVLVVDDERGVLEMSRLVLERNGYRIATASDGIEGVAFYARHMDEVALVVTDIHMPNFDGLSLVQAIRKLNPRIPIIGSTGQTCDDEDQKLMILGVNRFLRKPYTKRQLLATIRDLL